MTITCGIQPTIIVTMVMKVLHNSCNMYTLDLIDMYALTLEPVAVVLMYTYESNHSCTCYNYNNIMFSLALEDVILCNNELYLQC